MPTYILVRSEIIVIIITLLLLVYTVNQKTCHQTLVHIYLLNIDRFSKFFHWHTLRTICDTTVIKFKHVWNSVTFLTHRVRPYRSISVLYYKCYRPLSCLASWQLGDFSPLVFTKSPSACITADFMCLWCPDRQTVYRLCFIHILLLFCVQRIMENYCFVCRKWQGWIARRVTWRLDGSHADWFTAFNQPGVA